jgi:hypothetical protein
MYYANEFESIYETPSFDVIAIGNSKLLSAIDKKTLEANNKHTVAVLGYSSANISISKLTLETYLNNCAIKPTLILLEVSWFTFNTKRTSLHGIVGDLFIKDIFLWKNYFKFNNTLFPKIKSAFENNVFKNNPSISSESYANRFKKPSPLTVDYTFNISKMEVLFPEHIAGVDKLLLNDFNAILDLCAEEGIDLILFSAPEDEEYSRNQKDIEKIKAIYKKASNNYSNIFYLDYTLGGDLWNKKYEKWLVDSHHINENVLFTKKLIIDIKVETQNSLYKK